MTFEQYQKWCAAHDVAPTVNSQFFQLMPDASQQALCSTAGRDKYRAELTELLEYLESRNDMGNIFVSLHKRAPYAIRARFGLDRTV